MIAFVRYLATIITNTSPVMGSFVHGFPFYRHLLSSFEYEMKYQRETTIVFVGMLMAVTPDDQQSFIFLSLIRPITSILNIFHIFPINTIYDRMGLLAFN